MFQPPSFSYSPVPTPPLQAQEQADPGSWEEANRTGWGGAARWARTALEPTNRDSATKDLSGSTGVAWLTWFGAHSQRDQLSQSNSPEGSWLALCPKATSQEQVASGLLLGHCGARPPAKEVGLAPFLLATPGLSGVGRKVTEWECPGFPWADSGPLSHPQSSKD